VNYVVATGALSRILHLLSLHPDVQEKLRVEITKPRQANDENDLDFNGIDDLPGLLCEKP
jgi:hypothetical protein